LLTTSYFYTAGGESPQCLGVSSDIEVPGPPGLSEKERECASSKDALPAHSLSGPVYLWKEYLSNEDKQIRLLLPSLRANSSRRMAAKPATTAEEQLNEIVRVAAEFATLRNASL
jgi:hypothetical protein